MKRCNVVLYFVEEKFILDCNVMRVSKLCLFNSNHRQWAKVISEVLTFRWKIMKIFFHLWNNIFGISCSLNSIIWMAISSWHDGDTKCTDINTSEGHSNHRQTLACYNLSSHSQVKYVIVSFCAKTHNVFHIIEKAIHSPDKSTAAKTQKRTWFSSAK